MFTRRQILKGLGLSALATFAATSYAFALEPLSLRITNYRLRPKGWPDGLKLRMAVLADIHACEPWMSAPRIREIAEQANTLDADMHLLLGDYATGHRLVTGKVQASDWAEALSHLSAPLGTHAILGNHDWWDDRTAQRNGHGPVQGRLALEDAGIAVYENDAIKFSKDGHGFWLAGLGDQAALLPRHGRRHWSGVDDLPGTLARITDDDPAILMVHEPDIFPDVPERFALTLAGHTHGGQVRALGRSPVVPSRFGNRFAYGHITERQAKDAPERDLIVSGGLGCSIMPVRIGVPPEIVLVELG